MISIICIYLIFLLVLILLPESIWEPLFLQFKKVSRFFLVNRSLFLTRFFGDFGEKLINQLTELESFRLARIKSKSIKLCRYKFYADIVEQLLLYSRTYGAPINHLLITLRNGVIKDSQFERKLRRIIVSELLQFFLIITMIWTFVYFTSIIINTELSYSIFSMMILLQVIGPFSFFILFILLKNRTFASFDKYFSAIYALKALIGVGLPIKKTIELSKINNVINEGGVIFKFVNNRFYRILDSWQRRGTSIEQELIEIVDEVWFLQNQQFELFLKKVIALKFTITAIFILPSYLIFLYNLFQIFLS